MSDWLPWQLKARPSPAPWGVDEEERGRGCYLVIRDARGRAVAEIQWDDRADIDIANALLLCAAPDLLEVLEDAPDRSTYYGPGGEFEFDRFEADYDHWLDDRRVTLAKARGGK